MINMKITFEPVELFSNFDYSIKDWACGICVVGLACVQSA